MRGRIPIGPKNNLILIFQNLYRPPQIPGLKPRLKHQSGIIFWGGYIEWKYINCMLFGIDPFADGGILLIIHNFIEECIHEDDDLYIFLDGFFEDVGLGLEDGIELFILWLEELRICGE